MLEVELLVRWTEEAWKVTGSEFDGSRVGGVVIACGGNNLGTRKENREINCMKYE